MEEAIILLERIKMNVLLVGPQTSHKTEDMKGLVAPCLGLRRLQSYLRMRNHRCDVLNPAIHNTHAYLEAHAKNYELIGFSLLHASLEHDLNMMWTAYGFNPQTQIVAGGVEATLNPQVQQYAPPQTRVVRGEGELPLLALCNGEKDPCLHQPLSQQQFREANLKMDFTAIPYKRLWDETKRRHPTVSTRDAQTVRLITSSHCPMNCRFCSSSRFLQGPPKYLTAKDITMLVYRISSQQPETQQLFFQDDNFLLGYSGKQRAKQLATQLNPPFPLMAQCRLDDVVDAIPYLHNFHRVSVGVESFSQNMLDEFQKGLDADEIDNKLTMLLEAGLNVFVNIIITSPNCTRRDVQHTVKKCQEWMRKGVEFGISLYVIAFPGSDMAEQEKVEYKTVRVPASGAKFLKMDKILPRDKELAEKILKVERKLEGEMLPSHLRSRAIIKLMEMN